MSGAPKARDGISGSHGIPGRIKPALAQTLRDGWVQPVSTGKWREPGEPTASKAGHKTRGLEAQRRGSGLARLQVQNFTPAATRDLTLVPWDPNQGAAPSCHSTGPKRGATQGLLFSKAVTQASHPQNCGPKETLFLAHSAASATGLTDGTWERRQEQSHRQAQAGRWNPGSARGLSSACGGTGTCGDTGTCGGTGRACQTPRRSQHTTQISHLKLIPKFTGHQIGSVKTGTLSAYAQTECRKGMHVSAPLPRLHSLGGLSPS